MGGIIGPKVICTTQNTTYHKPPKLWSFEALKLRQKQCFQPHFSKAMMIWIGTYWAYNRVLCCRSSLTSFALPYCTFCTWCQILSLLQSTVRMWIQADHKAELQTSQPSFNPTGGECLSLESWWTVLSLKYFFFEMRDDFPELPTDIFTVVWCKGLQSFKATTFDFTFWNADKVELVWIQWRQILYLINQKVSCPSAAFSHLHSLTWQQLSWDQKRYAGNFIYLFCK